MTGTAMELTFPDNDLAARLFGVHHGHLARMEQVLGVQLQARGNQVGVSGPAEACDQAAQTLEALYERLIDGRDIAMDDVDAMLRLVSAPAPSNVAADAALTVKTRKRQVSPRSPVQADYLRNIDDNDLVFGLGPAGTGKTYLAVAKAVERLISGQVDRIILSRPAVEAGEQLGFLPGDMQEKVDPYLRPLYDALHDMMPSEQVAKRLESGEIEVAPLAFMRGRTLAHAFVILDEAQNTTAVQMKMFLTRLGENARMVVTGDLSQVDLPRGTRSGLRDAVETLDDVKGVGFTHFTEKDVVRHPLVSRIVRAYDARDRARKTGVRYEKARPLEPAGERENSDD